MSKMIDRVTKAIAEVYEGYADPVETPSNWARAKSAAEAAIAAMREPTGAMKLAAERFGDSEGFGSVDEWEAGAIWQDMINAALER